MKYLALTLSLFALITGCQESKKSQVSMDAEIRAEIERLFKNGSLTTEMACKDTFKFFIFNGEPTHNPDFIKFGLWVDEKEKQKLIHSKKDDSVKFANSIKNQFMLSHNQHIGSEASQNTNERNKGIYKNACKGKVVTTYYLEIYDGPNIVRTKDGKSFKSVAADSIVNLYEITYLMENGEVAVHTEKFDLLKEIFGGKEINLTTDLHTIYEKALAKISKVESKHFVYTGHGGRLKEFSNAQFDVFTSDMTKESVAVIYDGHGPSTELNKSGNLVSRNVTSSFYRPSRVNSLCKTDQLSKTQTCLIKDISNVQPEGSRAEFFGKGINGDGRGTNGDGKGTNGDGRGTNGDGKGTNGDGRGTNGDGKGTNGDGRGTNGDGKGTNGDGRGTNGGKLSVFSQNVEMVIAQLNSGSEPSNHIIPDALIFANAMASYSSIDGAMGKEATSGLSFKFVNPEDKSPLTENQRNDKVDYTSLYNKIKDADNFVFLNSCYQDKNAHLNILSRSSTSKYKSLTWYTEAPIYTWAVDFSALSDFQMRAYIEIYRKGHSLLTPLFDYFKYQPRAVFDNKHIIIEKNKELFHAKKIKSNYRTLRTLVD